MRIIQTNGKLIVNDKEIVPPRKKKSQSISIIDNEIFIDGYQLIDGKWKRTLRALYHRFF